MSARNRRLNASWNCKKINEHNVAYRDKKYKDPKEGVNVFKMVGVKTILTLYTLDDSCCE